jgi:hypothetical protein
MSEPTHEESCEKHDDKNENEKSSTKICEEVDICSNYANNKKLSFNTITTMEKMQWPMKWEGWCLWDSHPFTSIPIPILRKNPLDDPNIYRISDAVGWFCSPNCMKAYLVWLGGAHAWDTLMQMKVILRNVLGIDHEYAKAPPREKLSVFHPEGPNKGMTIDEFRKGHIFKQSFIKSAPFIINSIVTQECPPIPNQSNYRQTLAIASSNNTNNTNNTNNSSSTSSTSPVITPTPTSTTTATPNTSSHTTPMGQTTFDLFYATYRAQHGPPPSLTNPTGKPKRSKPPTNRNQPSQQTPLITDVVSESNSTSSTSPVKKKSKTRVKKV